MKTLVLIDFQTYYLNPIPEEKRKELIKNVIRISRVFMANDWPIIIVQFIDCGQLLEDDRLIEEIQDILSYKNTILVMKNKCDGSEDILDQIDLNKLSLNVIVGGVYTDECVFETVNGLAERDRHISITVLEDCIWPDKNSLIIEEDNEDKIAVHHQSELVIV